MRRPRPRRRGCRASWSAPRRRSRNTPGERSRTCASDDAGMSDPTARFTERVADYAAHRPTYPPELILLLAREGVLRPEDVVADVGSGTGILTAMLLANGNTIYAVEPNAAMADEALRQLGSSPRFHASRGRAESTGLADASCDVVTVAQAFHWF